MVKLSYYIIFSDFLNSCEESVLFSTRTSQIFLISKDLRTKLLSETFDSISREIIEELEKAKVLVQADENELLSIQNENREAIGSSTELYAVIQPSASCQLGCYYCGQSHSKENLSDLSSSLIVERIQNKLKAGNFKTLHVGWFGAEPLMGLVQMKKLTKDLKLISASSQVEYSAKVVTNGLSLKSEIFEELASQLNVRKIEVTLDGTADYHDSHRFTKAGGKSFDLIYKNLLSIMNRPDFEQLNCSISIRCNVDKRNWSDVSNLIKMLSKDGLQKKLSYFYPIGIYSWGQNDAHSNSLTKEEFAKKEIDWLIEQIEHGFSPTFVPSRTKQVCAAVSPSFEMYDAFGNVFNCTEVSYAASYLNTPYVLGNVKMADKISVERPLADWNDNLDKNQFPCTKCKMLPVCGGGCPKSWHEDMRACPSAKFNIKEKLALAYATYKSDIRELI